MALGPLSWRNIDPVPPGDANRSTLVLYKMAFCEAQLWGAQRARAVLSKEDTTYNELVSGHLSFTEGTLHDMTRAE